MRYSSALNFLEEKDVAGLLPTTMETVLQSEVGFTSSADDFAIRLLSIDAWFIAHVQGSGELHMRSMPAFRPPKQKHIILAMAIRGQTSSVAYPFHSQIDQLSLHPWTSGYDIMSSGTYEYIVAHLPFSALRLGSENLENAVHTCHSVNSGPGAVLAASMKALVTEAAYNIDASAKLKAMLPGIAHMARDLFTSISTAPLVSVKEARIEKIETFVNAHYNDPNLSADQVAAGCGMSRRQCFRLFDDSHESFAELVRRIRLEHAATMLRRSPLKSITSIAYDCGFNSTSIFARNFHDHFGQRPSILRRQAQSRTNRHDGQPVVRSQYL